MVGLWTRVYDQEQVQQRATDRARPEAESNGPPRPTLAYALPDPRQRRRRWVKLIAFALFGVATGVFAVAVVWRAAVVWPLYWQQQADASYLAAPNQAVWISHKKSSSGNRALVFSHLRLRPDGKPRIVRLRANNEGSQKQTAFQFQVDPPRALWDLRTGAISLFGWQAGWSDLDKLFAGQPDAADQSHFTIAYESRGRKGTIDGWLANDDSIKLEVRDGPLRGQ
jgi:hypothetical protein